ncbi:MAG: hypothetical protein AAB971_03690 [Patescibacteria group bacterium]
MDKLVEAQNYLESVWRPGLGLPTSPSHPDNWGANLEANVEAHLAMGRLDRAHVEYGRWEAARFPETGLASHYLLGSHMRGGGMIETNWIDARVQKVIELPNGEKVTPLAAPPNWVIAAEKIADFMEPDRAKLWVEGIFDDLCTSSMALYHERSIDDQGGLIVQLHQDELTFSGGALAQIAKSKTGASSRTQVIQQLNRAALAVREWVTEPSEQERLNGTLYHKDFTPVVDVAINALMAANNQALQRLADDYGLTIPFELQRRIRNTERALPDLIREETGLPEPHTASLERVFANLSHASYSIESWLAIARAPKLLGEAAVQAANVIYRLVEEDRYILPTFFRRVGANIITENAAEQGAISPTHSLEVARRLQAEFSGLREISDAALMLGEATMELLDDAEGFPRSFNPLTGEANLGGNVLTRRFLRKQEFWTPTATAVVAYRQAELLD